MVAITRFRKENPKVVINVGGLKHEVSLNQEYIYSGNSPPPGEIFLKKLKTGKNLKEDLIKVRKNWKKIFERGGEFCWLARIYTPGVF